jgi:hypothetical protein
LRQGRGGVARGATLSHRQRAAPVKVVDRPATAAASVVLLLLSGLKHTRGIAWKMEEEIIFCRFEFIIIAILCILIRSSLLFTHFLFDFFRQRNAAHEDVMGIAGFVLHILKGIFVFCFYAFGFSNLFFAFTAFFFITLGVFYEFFFYFPRFSSL